MGMFYRTIRMVDNGIKPLYVFDGKPPEMKSGEVCMLDNAIIYHYLININVFDLIVLFIYYF